VDDDGKNSNQRAFVGGVDLDKRIINGGDPVERRG
jgi:hypothetical protein